MSLLLQSLLVPTICMPHTLPTLPQNLWIASGGKPLRRRAVRVKSRGSSQSFTIPLEMSFWIFRLETTVQCRFRRPDSTEKDSRYQTHCTANSRRNACMERKEETVLSVKDLQYGLTFHMDKFRLANMMSRKRSASSTSESGSMGS